MSLSRACALLLWSMLAAPSGALAQQAMQQESQPPRNVDAGVFASDVRALLRRSDTFRSQCARIAADPRVRVRVSVTYSVEGNGRAQTTFRRYNTGAIDAEIAILFGEDYRELLAHEFEHVLEQIEGIDLRQEAAQGRAWEVGSGAFETRRAFLAGVQVLQETGTLPTSRLVALPARQ